MSGEIRNKLDSFQFSPIKAGPCKKKPKVPPTLAKTLKSSSSNVMKFKQKIGKGRPAAQKSQISLDELEVLSDKNKKVLKRSIIKTLEKRKT